jgi:hypothetical protein
MVRFIVFLGLMAMVYKLWPFFLLGLFIWSAALLAKPVLRSIREEDARNAKARADLIRRCEQQHDWTLAGDPRGTYGDYPPADLSPAKRPSLSLWLSQPGRVRGRRRNAD